MLWQEHLPLLAWHAPFATLDVALLVQFMHDLPPAADVNSSIAGMPQDAQQRVVAGCVPLDIAPILAGRHKGQLEVFTLQLAEQGVDARLTIEVVEDFLHGALHAPVGMFFLMGRATTDVARRKAFVQLAAKGLLPTALQHAIGDHGQFQFVEGALHAEQCAVLRIVGVVEAMFVGQQHVAISTEPDELAPVLIVARQPREFGGGDDSGHAIDDGFQQGLIIVASMLGTAGSSAVFAEQSHVRGRPAELLDVLLHAELPFAAFDVVAHLAEAALPHVDKSEAFQMTSVNPIVSHRCSPECGKFRAALSRAAW